MAAAAPLRRTVSPELQVVGILDELQTYATQGRNKALGEGFFEEADRFYQFNLPISRSATYRPLIRLSEVQRLIIQEANEITAPVPKFFITKEGNRDKDREKAFQANWVEHDYALELLIAEIHAGISGCGFIQPYLDPNAENGFGAAKIRARHPRSVFPDPGALDDSELNYLIFEDYRTVEELRQMFGARVTKNISLKREVAGAGSSRLPRFTNETYPAHGLQLPYGPMRSMGPLAGGAFGLMGPGAGRIRLRTMFIKDSTAAPFNDVAALSMIEEKILPSPDVLMEYPTGRMICEAQGDLLCDCRNPYPAFPLFRITAFPAIAGYWAPPPKQYFIDMQNLAEKMFSANFENSYRMNNVVAVVNTGSGLSAENFQVLPGETYFCDPQGGDKPIQFLTPPALSSDAQGLPQFMLAYIRDGMGFPPVRQGKAGAGNISAGLADQQSEQGSGLRSEKSRLYARSVANIGKFQFQLMMQHIGTTAFPFAYGDESPDALWTEPEELQLEQWKCSLDQRSLRPESPQGLRNLVLALKRLQMIDNETALNMLDVPDAEEIAKKLQQQMLLAALANQKPGGKGGKK
jgi:hypothetical protein